MPKERTVSFHEMFVVCHRHEASRENQKSKKRGPACEEGRTNEIQALYTYILLYFQGLSLGGRNGWKGGCGANSKEELRSPISASVEEK